jgi:hypothetical protein
VRPAENASLEDWREYHLQMAALIQWRMDVDQWRGTTGLVLPAKENASNQFLGCQPATACLEGRVSLSRRPFATNWLDWLVYTIFLQCERP